MSNKNKKNKESKALVIRPASLPADARALIQVATPQEFIRTRPGKGGRTFTYIEGGYVIARLNQIFSPVGWEFEVVSERVETTEVIVRGKLSIKDHANGYSISKMQYGMKERIAGIPLGDTIKAATTDALKKCASMLGIGLDVYWQQLDEQQMNEVDKKNLQKTKVVSVKPKSEELLVASLDKIKLENDPSILCQYKKKINVSDLYDTAQRLLLVKTIDNKLKTYE